ncbi:MAG: tetraacyldisaccharide 4'-kinase [Motiliproteus sp.]
MKNLSRLWYGSVPWLLPLWPLELLFRFAADQRRHKVAGSSTPLWQAPVPVIIVGNISVGGVGKTPLLIRIVEMLQQAGYRPGVVSRGYGGHAPSYPMSVSVGSDPAHCGDEPLMIACRGGCPVFVDPDRVNACKQLLKDNSQVNVILSDDGLQHYRLPRDLEIAVVDGERGLGNGHCLPVGPLREPESRLDNVDFCIVNGGDWKRNDSIRMEFSCGPLSLLNGEKIELLPQTVNAVAGIGNPTRFFNTLERLGFTVIRHPFPDHHPFSAADLDFDNPYATIMTEKDAVKCRALGADNRYYLPIRAELPAAFEDQLLARLEALIS